MNRAICQWRVDLHQVFMRPSGRLGGHDRRDVTRFQGVSGRPKRPMPSAWTPRNSPSSPPDRTAPTARSIRASPPTRQPVAGCPLFAGSRSPVRAGAARGPRRPDRERRRTGVRVTSMIGATFRGNKTALPSKPCAACGRAMSRRRHWAKNWQEVKYCSEACRRVKATRG